MRSYYRARYYDPQIGRFNSEDPVEFYGGINFYAYTGNDPTNWVDPSGYVPCLDVNSFVIWLDNHAHAHSTHKCAKYVRLGLEAGGLNTNGHPINARSYGPFLQQLGFSQVSPEGYSPETGDVVVIQPGPSPAGHIEAWDGNTWVSDFVQNPNHISPYRGPAPSYTIYRPTPCPGLALLPSHAVQSFTQSLMPSH